MMGLITEEENEPEIYKLNIHQMTIKGRLQSPKFENYKYKD